MPVATSIVIPILIGGSSGGDFGFNIPKSTTRKSRMSDDNGHDKVVGRDYVGHRELWFFQLGLTMWWTPETL